jgi:hypothetical protein
MAVPVVMDFEPYLTCFTSMAVQVEVVAIVLVLGLAVLAALAVMAAAEAVAVVARLQQVLRDPAAAAVMA